MNKTDAIDFSPDRLIAIAADDVEAHDYIGALKMLNKNAVLNGNDEDSYMLYAEVFDDMGLFEKCVNGWFKYIDYAGDGADLAEAYEGLAVSFMNMRQENFAAFYYNKLLMETDDSLTKQNRQDIINAFIKDDKPPLKFVYPPKLADFTDEIDSGMEHMRMNDFEGAVAEFSKVDEGNDAYLSARNYIAMCNVISDKLEEAEEECNRILEKDPSNVQAMTTFAAVRSQQGRRDDAARLAERLLALDPAASDDMYKIATVCCENGMHEQAFDLFSRLDDKFFYDCSILFFKAVAAYNCGKIQKSLEIFDLLLTVYPNAIAADYWHFVALNESKKREDKRLKELEYYYRLPRSECESNIKILTEINRLSDAAALKMTKLADVTGIIHWCFDEGDGSASYELKTLGALCAVKCRLEDTVRDILLDAFLQDGVKMETLNALAQQNTEGEYGIVVCNIYKRITIVPVNLGKFRKKTFLRAYGLAFSRFAILAEEYSYKLAAACEKLYEKLEAERRLEGCRSVSALAAAIVKFAELNDNGLNDGQIYSFFGTDPEKVNKLLGIEI